MKDFAKVNCLRSKSLPPNLKSLEKRHIICMVNETLKHYVVLLNLPCCKIQEWRAHNTKYGYENPRPQF